MVGYPLTPYLKQGKEKVRMEGKEGRKDGKEKVTRMEGKEEWKEKEKI